MITQSETVNNSAELSDSRGTDVLIEHRRLFTFRILESSAIPQLLLPDWIIYHQLVLRMYYVGHTIQGQAIRPSIDHFKLSATLCCVPPRSESKLYFYFM